MYWMVVFYHSVFIAKYSLNSKIIINMYTLTHKDSYGFILYNKNGENEAIPFVVHLSAPYLFNKWLCLFRESVKNYVALRACYTERHCCSDNVQHPTFDLISSPNPHFNTSYNVSTCCIGCFLSNLHVYLSHDG